MPQLSHEQRQRLFNYFAEAHDLLLLEDDFRMIDDLICSQHDGKPIVSRSKCDYHAAFIFCGDNGVTYCSNCGDPV